MMAQAPHIWVPRPTPLARPGNQRDYRLDDIAGRPLEPTEYATLRREIERSGRAGKREIDAAIRATTRAGDHGFRTGDSGYRSGIDNSGFTPADIGTLGAWFDAQDASSYTVSSGFVASVTNKKTTTVSSEPTTRPAYAATGLNGFHCWDFDGTNDAIDVTESTLIASLAEIKFTYFAVVHHDIVDRNNAVLGFGRTDNGNSRGWWGTNTAGPGAWCFSRINSAGTNTNRTSTANSDTVTHVHEWYDDSSTTFFLLDGTLDSSAIHTSVFGTIAPTNVLLGSDMLSGGRGDFLNGQMGEVLLFRGVLSASARKDVRHYLGDKWSVSVV